MIKIHSHRLLLALSLFLLPASAQVLAADNNMEANHPTEEATTTQSTVAETPVTKKISINKANNKELAAIKGIGPKKAQAIIDYRNANGDFVSLEELIKVKGIGKNTMKKITEFISL